MRKYSYQTFVDARLGVPGKEYAKLSSRQRDYVVDMLKRDLVSDYQYWKTLTEALKIMHHHPNQIVRHEAAFVLGDFPYRGELEKIQAVQNLRLAIRYDPSIVSRHESTEALGDLFCMASTGAGADLAKTLAFKLDHDDIIATAEESFDKILRNI